jgi:phenylacetic acid degradation operon negative regulatory protein
MKAKTEELLYYLLWFSDKLARPTYRNLDDSFESWAYRNGFLRRIHDLEKRCFVERNRSQATRRMYRLTEAGRLHVLGGRDPEQRWGRAWDGKWRVVLFDLPRTESSARKRLHGRLRAEGFGLLQNSVWVSPDPLSGEVQQLCGRGDDLSTVVSLEGTPAAGERAGRIVKQAWDFDEIDQRYGEHMKVLGRLPKQTVVSQDQARRLQRWAGQEREAWQRVMDLDPLLPAVLLPRGYRGRKAWKERQLVLAKAARLIATPR